MKAGPLPCEPHPVSRPLAAEHKLFPAWNRPLRTDSPGSPGLRLPAPQIGALRPLYSFS